MKSSIRAAAWLAALLLPIAAFAADVGGPVDLDKLAWHTQPNGVQIAVFLGDPREAGPYGVRAKLPPDWHIEPHTHPEEARVTTVIAGTFYWAQGETFDSSKLKAYGPGSVIIEARGLPHFAMTREEGTELQVTAIGPAGLTYLEGQR